MANLKIRAKHGAPDHEGCRVFLKTTPNCPWCGGSGFENTDELASYADAVEQAIDAARLDNVRIGPFGGAPQAIECNRCPDCTACGAPLENIGAVEIQAYWKGDNGNDYTFGEAPESYCSLQCFARGREPREVAYLLHESEEV